MLNRTKSVCLIFGLLLAAASSANAQYRAPFNAVPRINRALGHWNGFGYHTCNPGPDSSYYNPWTAKNSFLISQSPEFLSKFGHELNPTPMDLLHQGHNAFGQSTFPSDHSIYPAPAALNADFVPNTRDDEEDEDEEEEESSFGSGDDDDDFMKDGIDDRFDAEADDLEKENDPFGDQADAFEDSGADASDPGSLKEKSLEPTGSSTKGSSTKGSSAKEAANDQTTLLNPGGIYLPASHRSFEW